MSRRVVGALLASALILVPLAVLATSPTTLYLSGETTPVASLSVSSPPGGPLPDYGGSGEAGRRLNESDKGWLETNDKEYQLFKTSAGGLEISGQATLTIWVQMKDENAVQTGVIDAYLLDCGGTCTLLASASKTLVPGGPFVQTTLTFPSVSHTFAAGRDVALKIVVPKTSDDHMDIAYYRSSYPSRLVLPEVVATTTTTTTTTIASTTTTSGVTTTTIAGTTTTSPGGVAPPTTSTTIGPGGTGSPTTEPGAGEPVTTVAGETATTDTDPDDDGSALSGQGTTTSTLIAQPVSLDTEKSNLVIRTTPSQRGVTIEAASDGISPVEGLMVSFLTAVESIRSQLATSAALGALMTILLIVGLSRRRRDE